jgi:hypothetical protein
VVGKVINQQIEAASYIMTDESPVYPKIAREFGGHGTVNHSIKEYVRGGFWHTNTVENYFSIFKRGINGVYQAVSEKHLKRYLGEFDFRYNTRDVSDFERAAMAMKGSRDQFKKLLKRVLLETALRESTHPIMGFKLSPRK